MTKRDAVGFLVAEALTVIGLVLTLQLWNATPRVPLLYGGSDANLAMMTIKHLVTGGWVNESEYLSAPIGQQLYDYPSAVGDIWHILTLKILTFVIQDPALDLNIFFLLSFLLASATAYVSMRALRVRIPYAVVGGVLYAFAPYHFLRGQSHLFLSAYYAVPLACLLVVRQVSPQPLLGFQRGSKDRAPTKFDVASAVGIALLVAGTGLYYAVFSAALLGVTGLVSSALRKSWRPIAANLVLSAVIGAMLVISALPNVLYSSEYGANPAVGQRTYFENEYYGLRIVNMVVPVVNHRIELLANVHEGMMGAAVPGEGMETLGIVAAVGFLALLATAVGRLLSGAGEPTDVDRLAMVVVVLVLLSTVAGLSAVLAALGFTELRAWNRSSIFIGFASLTAVMSWMSRRSLPRPVGVVVAAALLVVGLADQTTPTMVPDHEATAAGWKHDEEFGLVLDRLFEEGDVFQLPYVPFPENPSVVGMTDYDHLRGYLHTDRLRWSYGAVKGREGEWQAELVRREPTDAVVERLAIAGFEAIWVDRGGYVDRGDAVEREIHALVGGPVAVTPGDRIAVYDLRPLQEAVARTLGEAQQRAIAEAITDVVRYRFDGRVYDMEEGGVSTWRWLTAASSVRLDHDDEEAREAVVAFDLDVPGGGAGTVVFRAGSKEWRLDAGPSTTHHELSVRVPPGGLDLHITTTLPRLPMTDDKRVRHVRLVDFGVDDPELRHGDRVGVIAPAT